VFFASKHSSYVQKSGNAGRLLQSTEPLADADGAADATLAGTLATLLAGTLAALLAGTLAALLWPAGTLAALLCAGLLLTGVATQ
jgi:hypothetical protein